MPGVKRKLSFPAKGAKKTKTKAVASKKRNAMVSVPRNKLGFPQMIKTKLRYAVRSEFNITSQGNVYAVRLRANDLYDPEVSTGGHQPRGFDDFMNVYEEFTCTGSRCSANFMFAGYVGPSVSGSAGNLIQTLSLSSGSPNETPALPAICCGIWKGVDQAGPGAGTVAQQIEKDRQRWTFLTPTANTKSLTASLRCSEFFGKQPLIGSEGYSGTASASPTNQLYWDVWAGRCDGSYATGVVKVPCFITVEYDVVFTKPKVLKES